MFQEYDDNSNGNLPPKTPASTLRRNSIVPVPKRRKRATSPISSIEMGFLEGNRDGGYWRHMGVSKNSGTPKWMVKIMENPIFECFDLGGKTTIFGNIHIDICFGQ